MLQPVTSSNIDKVGYDNNKLYVLFKNKSLYVYNNIDENVYNEMLKAESIGKFLNTEIKKNNYPFERIWDDDQLYKTLLNE